MTKKDVPASSGRLRSLDAFRGLVLLILASGGLGIASLAEKDLESKQSWSMDVFVHHASLSAWRGCTVRDLISPCFLFIAGAALPLADSARQARGQLWGGRFAHAAGRSLILIALGIILESSGRPGTNFTFVHPLTQMGLAYPFVFLLVGCRPGVQLGAASLILFGYWTFFASYPLPEDLRLARAIGFDADWGFLQGFQAHWEKNFNVAGAVDRKFLALFPQPLGAKFCPDRGGYATLNFVPTIASMILGALAGRWAASRYTGGSKVLGLVLAGMACLVAAIALDATICPIVKRIWTPSWVLWSTAWACWLFAAFYWGIEVRGARKIVFPLVVPGSNAIVFSFLTLAKPAIAGMLRPHLNTAARACGFQAHVDLFAGRYGPIVGSCSALIGIWLIGFWMYRRGIFVKIGFLPRGPITRPDVA